MAKPDVGSCNSYLAMWCEHLDARAPATAALVSRTANKHRQGPCVEAKSNTTQSCHNLPVHAHNVSASAAPPSL